MKTLKKITAVLSSLALAATMLYVPTTAYAETSSNSLFPISEEDAYYSDPANIAWELEDVTRYEDGTMISVYKTEYGVLIEHSADTALSAGILGLPEGYTVTTYDTLRYDLLEGIDGVLSVVWTETYEEAYEISYLANSWLEKGIVTRAEVVSCNFYSCSFEIGLSIDLKDPENEPVDFTEYGFAEENIREISSTATSDYDYACTFTQSDLEDINYINDVIYKLENNGRVADVEIEYGGCEVIHIYHDLDPVSPPTYTLEELYNMSDDEFLYLDGAEEMYAQIENDVNSVEQYGEDLILYGGISGHLVELHVQDTNYNANATEQAIEKLLGGTVNYQIESPINIAVDDLFYEYKFHLYFNDMDKSAVTGEITEEDIMEMAKCWYCVNQVIDIGYWESLLIGMDVAPGDEPILTGDANFDKSVDVYDAIWISNYIVEVYNFTDSQKVIADVNDDGFVDVSDAVGVAMYVLNAESNPLE